MKNLIKVMLVFAFLALNTNTSLAMLGESEVQNKRINLTGFPDYPPFGETGYTINFRSMFDDFLIGFKEKNSFIPEFIFKDNYNDTVQEIRTGKIDLIIGMYNATALYNGIDFIYPAVTINPIHIITLPSRTNEIQQIEDVKGLKGAVHTKEHFSDYAEKQIADFNLEKIDDTYKLYEKLFKGEIDYIFSSRYFAMIETSKLGIKNKISFSKKPIWVMPLFFGVSKSYKYRRQVTEYIGSELKKPEVKEKINNYLIEIINNVERENAGVVPPTFATEQK